MDYPITITPREELAKSGAADIVRAYGGRVGPEVAQALLDGYNRIDDVLKSVAWLAEHEGGKVKAKHIRQGGSWACTRAASEYRETLRQILGIEDPTTTLDGQRSQALSVLRRLVAAYRFQAGDTSEDVIRTVAGK